MNLLFKIFVSWAIKTQPTVGGSGDRWPLINSVCVMGSNLMSIRVVEHMCGL